MQRGQHKKCWLLSNHGSKKNCIFDLKFCIVLCYTYETPIFRLRWTQLTWIINPSYPEVTLDTFRFLVDGRLAAWLAVSWPQLPKVALFGPITLFFGPKSIFLWPASKSCYNGAGTPKRQPVCVDCIAGSPGGRPGPF